MATKATPSKKKHTKASAEKKIRRELDAQIEQLLTERVRQMDYDPAGKKEPTKTYVHEKPKVSTHKACPAHSKCWKQKISRHADKLFSELQVDQIWNFHDFKKTGKISGPDAPVVQNYTRCVGNILHAPTYKGLYTGLKKSQGSDGGSADSSESGSQSAEQSDDPQGTTRKKLSPEVANTEDKTPVNDTPQSTLNHP